MNIYPEYTIKFVDENESSLTVLGLLNRTFQGKEQWIKDGWVGTLKKGNKIAFGRWSKSDELWCFKFDDEERDKIIVTPGEVVFAIEGYWGERVEIVVDEDIIWKQCEFHAEKEWDHDHCAICWASISEHENTIYFLGNDRHPVCSECYNKHVKTKDISFVPNA